MRDRIAWAIVRGETILVDESFSGDCGIPFIRFDRDMVLNAYLYYTAMDDNEYDTLRRIGKYKNISLVKIRISRDKRGVK